MFSKVSICLKKFNQPNKYDKCPSKEYFCEITLKLDYVFLWRWKKLLSRFLLKQHGFKATRGTFAWFIFKTWLRVSMEKVLFQFFFTAICWKVALPLVSQIILQTNVTERNLMLSKQHLWEIILKFCKWFLRRILSGFSSCFQVVCWKVGPPPVIQAFFKPR